MAVVLRHCFRSLPQVAARALPSPLRRRHFAETDASRGVASSSVVRGKRFILKRHFLGEPQESDFELVEEDLPPLKDGEVLVEAEYLSVDPYMRVYVLRKPPGDTMIGGQVGRVVASQHVDWREGERVVGDFGWRSKTIFAPAAPPRTLTRPFRLPDLQGLSPSLGVGALGMPGNTAYFGLLEVCRPVPGETVLVSGAAGAVGSLVGQIAKIKGCRVIGFAGSDDKVKWLKDDLGFDAAYNYKTVPVHQALKDGAPKGVDCYFDNVGGAFSSSVVNRMNHRGRIAVCGSISSYNADPGKYPSAPLLQPGLVTNELIMEGFMVTRWNDRWEEGIKQNLHWIREGKLKVEETVTNGFENLPKALIGMLRGENKGKAVVKA